MEVDAFEEELLTDPQDSFHILVATPEKLSLVVRNKKVTKQEFSEAVHLGQSARNSLTRDRNSSNRSW